MPDGSPPACFTAAASCEHSCFSASVACGGRLGGGKEGVPPPVDAWTPTLTCARMLLPPRVLPPLPLAPTAPVAPPETPTVVVVVDELCAPLDPPVDLGLVVGVVEPDAPNVCWSTNWMFVEM